jgi:diaminobutyrate-2-oxoglutarate transaminase
MLGVEIVHGDGRTDNLGQPLAHPELASRIQRACFNRGLILELGGRHSSVVRFLPPLIVTEAQIQRIADIFSQAVNEACGASLETLP